MWGDAGLYYSSDVVKGRAGVVRAATYCGSVAEGRGVPSAIVSVSCVYSSIFEFVLYTPRPYVCRNNH